MTKQITITFSSGKEVVLRMNQPEWAEIKKKITSMFSTAHEVYVDGEWITLYPAQICYIREKLA